MSQATFSQNIVTVQGTFNVSRTIETEGETVRNPSLAPAKVGALTTRTSDSVGTLTMAVGHGFVNGDRLDIYWVNPDGSRGFRYGITVGVVAGESVPITAGAGDVLPADETAITAMVPEEITFPVTAADMKMLIVACPYPAQAVFLDITPALVAHIVCDGESDSYVWDDENGLANPFAADTVTGYLSHGSSDNTAVVKAIAMVD